MGLIHLLALHMELHRSVVDRNGLEGAVQGKETVREKHLIVTENVGTHETNSGLCLHHVIVPSTTLPLLLIILLKGTGSSVQCTSCSRRDWLERQELSAA
jgi:hypothetical protein